MPKIKILKTMPIAEDGIHVKKYSEGWEGEVSAVAAEILVSIGAGRIVRERTAPSPESHTDPDIKPQEGTENLKSSEGAENLKPQEGTEEGKKRPEEKKKLFRVFNLSDELGVSSAKIIATAKKLGIFATNPMSGLSPEEISGIKAEFEKPKR